jgi:acetate kinase
MRELLTVARRSSSQLAIQAFCYRAKKYLGAYLAALGGADVIIFGGGIGENLPEIREEICSGLEWAGLQIDHARNNAVSRMDEMISTDGSRIEAWVVHVDEAVVIARDVMDGLRSA